MWYRMSDKALQIGIHEFMLMMFRWMDAWMCGWMTDYTYAWMDGHLYACMGRWMVG